jgi:hypothetical protein
MFEFYQIPIAKLSMGSLLVMGALGGGLIVGWSYSNWRAAVKVAFIMAIIEGALRKWFFQSAQELVYFGKDMFLIGAYLRFFLSPDPEIRAYRLVVPATLVTSLCAVVALSALNPNIGHPLLALIGLKGYFMYVPLAFLIPYLFRNENELVRQLTWFALIATPVCILGFLQWKSDRFSVLNTFATGMLDSGAVGFGFDKDIDKARITGTFSYITGHSTFVLFFTTLHLALLMCRQSKLMRLWLMGNLPLLAANALMNGSRSGVYGIAMVAGGFAIVSLSYKLGPNQKKVIGTMITAGIIVAVGASFWFADSLAMFQARAKYGSDNIEDRVFKTAEQSLDIALNHVGPFGYGMGVTMPVTSQLRRAFGLAAPKKRPPLMDHELMQMVVELGLIGVLAWYGLRLVVLLHGIHVFRISPPTELRAIVLASILVQIPYFYASVVLNHTANILIWGFIGLSFIPALQPTVLRRHHFVAPPVLKPGPNPPPIPFRRGSKVR